MSLNPRAIAVQGVGYSPRLLALQGLWPSRRVRLSGGTGAGGAISDPNREAEELTLLAMLCAAWSVPAEAAPKDAKP